MEAKGVAVVQRIGGGTSEGNRLAAAGTARVRDNVQESSMRRIYRDEPARQDKVLYPLQSMLRKLGIHVLKDMCLPREVSDQ